MLIILDNLITKFLSFVLIIEKFLLLKVDVLNFFCLNRDSWKTFFDYFMSYFGILLFLPYINIFLIFTTSLFFIGLGGLLFGRRNLIYLLLCYEILTLSIVLDFFYASLYVQQSDGFVYGLIVIALAAIESTVGLSIIVSYYRRCGVSSISLKSKSKGN